MQNGLMHRSRALLVVKIQLNYFLFDMLNTAAKCLSHCANNI